MENEENKTPIELLSEHLTTVGWVGLNVEATKISAGIKEEFVILEKKKDKYHLSFVWFNGRKSEYGVRYGLKNVVLDKDADFQKILYLDRSGYKLSYDSQVKGILQLNSGAVNNGNVEILDISSKHTKISISKKDKTLKIPTKKYLEILDDAKEISKKANSYSSAVSRYLTNKFSKKHINKSTKLTTSIEKGEFDFLVHRFNLETKKKKQDYDKYLNKNDVSSLQELVIRLIQKEVFDSDFLRQLDEYFIREKLKEIIALGREILSLKSGDLSTEKAKKIIEKVTDGKPVKQLETLWQRFFEKYLLYLIFSYKEIYQKVELEDLENDKKFPDFLGINHYNGVDVIEIKTHLTPALIFDRSHKNFSFSSDMSKAIIQTVNYLDAIKQQKFKDESQKEKITETINEENLYRPRGIIIISSRNKLSKNNMKERATMERDFTKLRNSLHNIEILTFDEILDIADHYCEKIIGTK